jgi:cytochrome P450
MLNDERASMCDATNLWILASRTMQVHQFKLFSRDFKANPFPVLRAMREAGPVVRSKVPIMGKAWLVTTHEAVCELLKDHERFVREGKHAGKHWLTDLEWWLSRFVRAPAENMLAKDEPDHRRLRGLVEQAFQRRSVDGMRGRIEAITDELLDESAAKAGADRVVDFTEFAQQLPLAVICELLGLPQQDRPKFTRWAEGTTSIGSLLGLARLLPNMYKVGGYFRRQFRACRETPREGLLSLLVQAEHAGESLSEDELMSMGFLLLFAGHVTTTHLLAGGLFDLLDHPEQKAEVTADPALLETAVEEMLRYRPPVPFTKPRMPREDVEFYGQKLRQGEYVLAMLASANVDPARFDEPETFDIHRDPNPHVSFGTGIHVCLGLKLARLEARVAFERLLARFPGVELAVPRDEVPWSKGGMRTFSSLPVRLNA